MATVTAVTAGEVRLDDGRVLTFHDSGPTASGLVLGWHHGSPQTGALLDPLLSAAHERGIRLVSYGRPSYGGSTPQPGRDVAAAAGDTARVMDAIGVEQFVTMGASGGGPHALACAALLPGRVLGVATFAGLAPFTASFDWFAGMASPGGPQAARDGRAARAEFAATDDFDPNQFIATDWAALSGTWTSLGADAGRASAAGPDGLIDDDVAFTKPWGFDLADVAVPVLVVQGGADRVVPRSHAEWLLAHCPLDQLWLRPRDGHVTVLDASPVAMDWLRQL